MSNDLLIPVIMIIFGLIFTLILRITYRICIILVYLYLSAAFTISGKAAQAKSILKAIPDILLGAVTLKKDWIDK